MDKKCKKCNKTKDISEFYYNRTEKYYFGKCKYCMKLNNRIGNIDNKPKKRKKYVRVKGDIEAYLDRLDNPTQHEPIMNTVESKEIRSEEVTPKQVNELDNNKVQIILESKINEI